MNIAQKIRYFVRHIGITTTFFRGIRRILDNLLLRNRPVIKRGAAVTLLSGRRLILNPDDTSMDAFPPNVDVRAVVEGQFLSMRLHGANIGIHPTSILATGGASANAAILQIIADVFGTPVFTGEQANSASLGAGYRALHGYACEQAKSFIPFAEVMKDAPPFKRSAEPNPEAHGIYTGMLERYARLETKVMGEQ